MKEEVGWNLLDDVLSDVRHGQVRCSIESTQINDQRGVGPRRLRICECIRFLLSKETSHFGASEQFDGLVWLIIFRVT